MEIKKDMLINKILEEHPEIATILMGYGLACVGCHFSGVDTIESGAKIHGLGDEEIEMMLKDVNALLENFD